ncbi:MAG: hypothetical protein A3F72_13085 [Bacteroidetes bacterium RIFCSPLOWO2_12_FULL_35_15]|nr:MAG: hypothetical protein A3F72_13085 [Bacteroidetes bacterium RIFCSPLOWO2_12_FULL_35_15]
MKNLILVGILFCSGICYGQLNQSEQPFAIVEKMPTFPGGNDKMMKFIQTNITYPEFEKEHNITGTCYVTFVVEKDSTLSGIKILRGVAGGQGCDKEALRVISIMPKWNPGTQNGNLVSVQYNLPIKFYLR